MVQKTYYQCDQCKEPIITGSNAHYQVRIEGESDVKDYCGGCWVTIMKILDWLGIPHSSGQGDEFSFRLPKQIVISRSYLDTGCQGEV